MHSRHNRVFSLWDQSRVHTELSKKQTNKQHPPQGLGGETTKNHTHIQKTPHYQRWKKKNFKMCVLWMSDLPHWVLCSTDSLLSVFSWCRKLSTQCRCYKLMKRRVFWSCEKLVHISSLCLWKQFQLPHLLIAQECMGTVPSCVMYMVSHWGPQFCLDTYLYLVFHEELNSVGFFV